MVQPSQTCKILCECPISTGNPAWICTDVFFSHLESYNIYWFVKNSESLKKKQNKKHRSCANQHFPKLLDCRSRYCNQHKVQCSLENAVLWILEEQQKTTSEKLMWALSLPALMSSRHSREPRNYRTHHRGFCWSPVSIPNASGI